MIKCLSKQCTVYTSCRKKADTRYNTCINRVLSSRKISCKCRYHCLESWLQVYDLKQKLHYQLTYYMHVHCTIHALGLRILHMCNTIASSFHHFWAIT